jgi:hypothetical protein
LSSVLNFLGKILSAVWSLSDKTAPLSICDSADLEMPMARENRAGFMSLLRRASRTRSANVLAIKQS